MQFLLSDWAVVAAGLAMVALLAENMLGVTGAALLVREQRKHNH